MTVLIVDPSRTVTGTLCTLFAKHGFEPRVAQLGREALEILERGPVELLCFAHELGDMNGIDLLIAAKTRHLMQHQPAVMFTSSVNQHIVSRALQAGVTECFEKRHLDQLEHFVENFAASNRLRITGHVLLVEDSVSAAQYYRQILERLGLVVDACASAEDATLRFADKPYDLVITDYVLSGVGTGLSVIRAVRDTVGKKSQTPILAISAFKDTARKIEVLRSGANDFVAKPVVPEELEVRVSNLVKMQKMLRQLESQHDAMKQLSMRDPLTALCNRSHLHEVMPGLIADAHEASRPLALLVFDLDYFKRINDAHGHSVGDQVLELMARTLHGACHSHELVARVGGEEFVAVLPGTGFADAVRWAEAVRLQVAALELGDITCTVSIGVAMLTDGDNYETLFQRADDAMYQAKHNGRNRVETAQ